MSKRVIRTDGEGKPTKPADLGGVTVEKKEDKDSTEFTFTFDKEPEKKPAEKPAPEPAKKPEEKPAEPVPETPPKKPAAKKPAAKKEPAKKPEEKPAEPVRSTPVVRTTDLSGAFEKNGLGHGYVFRDRNTGIKRKSSDFWAAYQASNGVLDVVWVWYVDGVIHHILDNDELEHFGLI